MALSRQRVEQLVRRLLVSWYAIPPAFRRIFLFVAVAGILPWLTITSYDVRNYVRGAEQLLSGQSVYSLRLQSPTSGELVPYYPYLPSFAMLVGVGILPFFFLSKAGVLPEVAYEILARQIANGPGYLALVGVPVLAYRMCPESVGATEDTGDISQNWVFWGVLVVTLTPSLWFQVLESGSDTFVSLLVLLGLYAVNNDEWTAAGLLVGAATFKFTALPIAAVLALYALLRSRSDFVAVALGGLVSQLPNVLYFVVFPGDFLFVLRRRGSMSLYSGETRSVATAPFRAAGLEQWYVEIGFIFVFVVLVAIGTAVALSRENLALGFAIAYLATSYFAPVGEVNSSVIIILLLVDAATNFHRKEVRYLAAGLLTVELYSHFFLLRHIEYVSAVPFPEWTLVIRLLEFGAISTVLVGRTFLSDT